MSGYLETSHTYGERDVWMTLLSRQYIQTFIHSLTVRSRTYSLQSYHYSMQNEVCLVWNRNMPLAFQTDILFIKCSITTLYWNDHALFKYEAEFQDGHWVLVIRWNEAVYNRLCENALKVLSNGICWFIGVQRCLFEQWK